MTPGIVLAPGGARRGRRPVAGWIAAAFLALISVSLPSVPPVDAVPSAPYRPGQRIESRGVGVVAPSPGHGVFAHHRLATGEDRRLVVVTWPDGTVEVTADGRPAGASWQARAASGPSACSDDAYSFPLLFGWEWTSTYRWWFQASSTPSEVSVANAETAIREGGSNVTGVYDNCGLPDRVGATISYQGRTSRAPGISSSGTCGAGDGVNVTGFGDLPPGVLGATCVEFGLLNGIALESDMKLNGVDFRWVVNIGSGCSEKWSVEAVTTHERGHTYGLDHVAEEGHGFLTMSTASNGPCQASESTLGLGDVLGLERLY